MNKSGKNEGHFPCHIYGIREAEEIQDTWETERVRDYGETTALGDGTILHGNYNWDEGGRSLLRCRTCGALMIYQRSVYNDMFDGPDGYYKDWIPAASEEEADLLNILWDTMELENYPFRHFRSNNREFFWTEGEEPKPYDPEEVKKKIREKYAKLTATQKQMLEKMIGECGGN